MTEGNNQVLVLPVLYNERWVQAREGHGFTNSVARSVNNNFYWILTLPICKMVNFSKHVPIY